MKFPVASHHANICYCQSLSSSHFGGYIAVFSFSLCLKFFIIKIWKNIHIHAATSCMEKCFFLFCFCCFGRGHAACGILVS